MNKLNTCQECNTPQTPKFIEKIAKTNLDRYGYSAAFSNPLIKEKIKHDHIKKIWLCEPNAKKENTR